MLEILEVKNKADLKKFIFLPEKIHKDHKNWLIQSIQMNGFYLILERIKHLIIVIRFLLLPKKEAKL